MIMHMLNPGSKSRTEAEARTKARGTALALLLSAIVGAIGVMLLQQNPELLREQMEAATAQSGGAAGMEDMMTSFAIGGAWFIVGLQLLLALIQWLKPNIVLPIILLILTAFGLLSAAAGFAMNPEQARAQLALQPMWLTILNYTVMAVGVLLHISSIIGANELSKMRRAGQAD